MRLPFRWEAMRSSSLVRTKRYLAGPENDESDLRWSMLLLEQTDADVAPSRDLTALLLGLQSLH